METMEQNKQIVQEGLDNNKRKRKEDIADKEHEVITINMFNIINTHASNEDTKRQIARSQIKANDIRNKKIAKYKKRRNEILVNIIAAAIMILVAALFYIFDVTELLYAAVMAVAPMFMLVFNICKLVNAKKKVGK